MKRSLLALAAVMTITAPVSLQSQQSAGGEKMRVLWIAAHPDDEDTQMITWLSRGGRAETAYLSLTRGDGGQNLIGNELGEQLGIIRTEELLAARRIDGAVAVWRLSGLHLWLGAVRPERAARLGVQHLRHYRHELHRALLPGHSGCLRRTDLP